MAIKVVVHSPKGGQGKTTLAANLAMMLASAGKRVLAIDADESESRGLSLYFNVQAKHGLYELLSGTSLEKLAGQVRENLFFLPGGDLVQANRLIDQERATPNAVVEDRLKPYEQNFDYIFFDTSPNPKTRLIFNLFYCADQLIVPIETKRAGIDVLGPFMDLVDHLIPRMRQPVGKEPLRVTSIIPYWHRNTNANQGSLEILQERYGDLLTKPVHECTALVEAWAKGDMFTEYLTRTPRDNEARVIEIFTDLKEKLLAI